MFRTLHKAVRRTALLVSLRYPRAPLRFKRRNVLHRNQSSSSGIGANHKLWL